MKLLPFDLEKALNGAKLVTRDGRSAVQFRPRLRCEGSFYPFEAFVDGSGSCSYLNNGVYHLGYISTLDLFLADEVAPEPTPPAPDLLPNYKRMYEMLELLKPSLMPEQMKQVNEILLTAKID